MESLVNRQIQAILKGETLYTRDVFVPAKAKEELGAFDYTEELKAAAALAAKLKETAYFSSVMEEIGKDHHVCVIATIQEKEDFVNFTIRMEGMEISCDQNGVEAGADELCQEFDTFSEAYGLVCRIVDGLSEESWRKRK